MKPIDSAWVILKQPETMGETPSMGGSGAQAFIDPQGRAMGQAGPFMFNIGGGGGGRPSTTSLLHRLATGQSPVGQGTRRALLGRAAGTGLGAVNALLAADRAQRGGDIESALGAAYAGYQVPKQGVTGAVEGEWGQKPMLDAHGRPLLDEEGKPRLQEEATPGGAIGGQMEATDLAHGYLQQRRDAKVGGALSPNPMGFGGGWEGGLAGQVGHGEYAGQGVGYGNDPRRQMPTEYGVSQPLPQQPAPLQPTTQAGLPTPTQPYGTISPVETQPLPVPGSTASQQLAEMRGQPNEVGLEAFTNSEPMDLAFRMLKGVMR